MSSTIIRGTVAEGADGERIRRLAALTGSQPPEGLMLLAEVQGDPVAAIGIFDGHAISDPDRSTFALRMRLRLLRLQLRLTLPVFGI
ncbi:MAG: hypothetical protein JO262_14045 [Solirubrobacterales bacterium]|nr:hypothetical protein [Solirubrobacterales bacterium]